MCGIAGMAGHGGPIHRYYGVAGRMLETLTHRGPDCGGIVFSKGACLVHCQMSGEDRENARHPIELRRGGKRWVISCSGELYNADELRRRLTDLGCRFKTGLDTELLLAAYAEWGPDCLRELNGVFAFVIWEEESETLFCARDRFGIKPFFYALEHGMLIFGSEIETLMAHPFVEPTVDAAGVAELTLIGPGRTPGHGVFQRVRELPAGHGAKFDKSGFVVYPYYVLCAAPHTESLDETADHVRELVTDAVRRQLAGDGPVCTMLSGGLDSSIVSAVAKGFLPDGALTTFSVDYADNEQYFQPSKFQPGSDARYIEIMNDFLQCPHTNVRLDTDALVNSLFRAVDARGLPGMADVDGSLLLFCQELKNHAAVALSGECADELFGGYPWYRDKELRETDAFPWSQSTEYRASFLRDGVLDGIDPGEYVYQKYKDTLTRAGAPDGDSPLERRMREMMRLNLDWFMQTLLTRAERMGAYAGLEIRVPFCDHRIVEYLYNVPWEFKDYQNREKGLLRHAMRDILPEEVLWRKKSPYPKTHHPDYLARAGALLREIIDDKHAPLLEIIRAGALERLLNEDRAVPWYGQLMTTPQTIAYFVQINYWMQKFKVRMV